MREKQQLGNFHELFFEKERHKKRVEKLLVGCDFVLEHVCLRFLKVLCHLFKTPSVSFNFSVRSTCSISCINCS